MRINRAEYLENLKRVVATEAACKTICGFLTFLGYARYATGDPEWLANFNTCRRILSDIACVDMAAAQKIHAWANGWDEPDDNLDEV